jgi:hypothetical protein
MTFGALVLSPVPTFAVFGYASALSGYTIGVSGFTEVRPPRLSCTDVLPQNPLERFHAHRMFQCIETIQQRCDEQ